MGPTLNIIHKFNPILSCSLATPLPAFFGGRRNKGGFNARIYFLSALLLMIFWGGKSVFMTFIRYGESVA
jgi:hypothetical protein